MIINYNKIIIDIINNIKVLFRFKQFNYNLSIN
jgi:hypothetical protein